MKGREGKGATSTDLLVCFPSRAHLTLIPKSICSPARASEPNKRYLHHHHHLKKSSTGAPQGSPLLWARNKPMGSDISEPTSPKVTCAGQIKVRSKAASSCKNWQSVMEEIERIHINDKKQHKKRSAWVDSLGFKKEILQFLTCLRGIRLDFRCFGSFPAEPDITTDEDDEEEDDHEGSNGNETSRTAFSKWFMVLQENQTRNVTKNEENHHDNGSDDDDVAQPSSVPPPNALLLMRCRSAPAKCLVEVGEEHDADEKVKREDKNEKDHELDAKKAKLAELFMEEEEMIMKRKRENNMVVMRYDTDFYKLSSDIAEETWVVGGIRSDPFSRSLSWKR